MDHVQAGLATLFASGTSTGLSDIELLQRFASRGDRMAFEVLVGRHATLIMNVCLSLLADPNDADDAFQATFLVLARKAGSIRAGDALAAWLCRVAYRIAVRARTESTRRRQVELRAAEQHADRIPSENRDRPGIDELAILFDELDRLPERYRAPVVLCHLEGLSTEAAAQHLGCPVGTIWARLSRARTQLRSRLVRRGVSLSAGALTAGLFPRTTQAAISSEVVQTTVRASLRHLAIDGLAAGATSARACAWTDAALRAMVHAKLRTAAMILLLAGAVATLGAGVFARGERGAPGPPAATAGRSQPEGRTIRFPDDRALGILYVQDGEPLDRSDSRRRIGEARGLVRLPARGSVELDLSKAALADLTPLDQLAPDAIQSLSLDHLAAHDDDLRHVEHLKGLKEIRLEGNFITNDGLKHLVGLEELEAISLSDSLIGDAGIRRIAGLPRIRSLGLYRSRITDEALRSVGTLKALMILDLGETDISDRGIGYLKDLKKLRRFRFGHTQATDASLAIVGGMIELQSLDFDSVGATDAGLAHLVGLKKLKKFRAYNNGFTDVGLAHLARLPALEELNASHGSRFTDAGLASLAELRTLRDLRLNGGKFSDAGLAHLARLPHLEDLWLSSSSGAITRRSMLSLSRIPTLKRLELTGCSLGGTGLAALSQSPSLESLILGDATLTFDDLAQLEKFSRLKDLRFFRMAANPGRPTLRHFRNLKSLTWLELPNKSERGPRDGIDFEPAEFAHLSGLTRLENFEYAGRITDEGLAHFAPLTAMTDLRLRNPQLTDEGLKSLSRMTHLEFLVIGGRITDEGVRSLQALTSLRFLSLETRTVSFEAIGELRSKLPTLHTVQPFDQLNELYRGPKVTDTKVGANAPDFTVTTRQGKAFRLADQRGKVVLIHFWGPKCAPFLRTLPQLKAMPAGRSDRFAMIGLAADMEDKAWRAFLDSHGIDWPQALLSGESLKVWEQFRVLGIPDYAVVNFDGKIIADGASTGRDVDKLKAAILKAMGD